MCIFRVNGIRTASRYCKRISIQLRNIYIAVCYFYFLRHEGCKVALITSILYIDRNRSSVKLNILCSAVACICPNNNASAAPGDRPCNVTPHGAITPLSFSWELPPPMRFFVNLIMVLSSLPRVKRVCSTPVIRIVPAISYELSCARVVLSFFHRHESS